jgi:hypothetical protein
MLRPQLAFTIEHHQAPHRRLTRKPLIILSREVLFTHARDLFPDQQITKVTNDRGTYLTDPVPTDNEMSSPLTTK